jgi:hypothetical protein
MGLTEMEANYGEWIWSLKEFSLFKSTWHVFVFLLSPFDPSYCESPKVSIGTNSEVHRSLTTSLTAEVLLNTILRSSLMRDYRYRRLLCRQTGLFQAYVVALTTTVPLLMQFNIPTDTTTYRIDSTQRLEHSQASEYASCYVYIVSSSITTCNQTFHCNRSNHFVTAR